MKHYPDPFSLRLVTSVSTALIALGLAGCVHWRNAQRHEASSVVQFLYPGVDQPFIQPQIPTLRLPLRVGIAFVPPGTRATGQRLGSSFSEAQKDALLRRVADQFKTLPFVSAIEIVPTTYLRPGGGFANLDQLRSLMGIDVIALVAYDQSQNTSDTAWSLAYWTIVGAYVVPAQKNDTHTLMEAVVYDIPSRSLLFRAPGTSAITGNATYVRTAAELTADSVRSYDAAAVEMTAALQRELDLFKVRAKEQPQTVRIEHKPGYTGGGALEGAFAALLLFALAGRRLFARR